MDKKLAIVTTNFENYQVTKDFLSSVENSIDDRTKVFISDLSTNIQSLIIKKWAEVIAGKNLGYAHGINLGLKKGLLEGFDQFVVINNDIRVRSDFVSSVVKSVNKHPTSIIGGKIYYEQGYEYHKDRYELPELGKVIWYAGGEVDWKHAVTHHIGVDEIDRGQYDTSKETEFITGCLMCFDKSVIEKVGFLDESYFLYYEDTDYCERAKNRGVKLYFDPSITIWHKNAQSTQGVGSKLHQKYQNTNRIKFGLKYAPLRTKIHLLKNYLLNLK